MGGYGPAGRSALQANQFFSSLVNRPCIKLWRPRARGGRAAAGRAAAPPALGRTPQQLQGRHARMLPFAMWSAQVQCVAVLSLGMVCIALPPPASSGKAPAAEMEDITHQFKVGATAEELGLPELKEIPGVWDEMVEAHGETAQGDKDSAQVCWVAGPFSLLSSVLCKRQPLMLH
jgi:hypothetical protein